VLTGAEVTPFDEGARIHLDTTARRACETFRRIRQQAMQHPVAVRMDWETPPEFFAALDAEFHFTLDVCATTENAKCERYISEDVDALSVDWSNEVCWMNPPYGAEIPKWMAKAWNESRHSTVVCLVPARTDTRWWHQYAERGERRFVQGRIRFVGARYNAPFPSAIVVFRRASPGQETR
jgi:phage N-6-adenine-methyltransferase